MKLQFLTIIRHLTASDWLISIDICLMVAILCSTLLRKQIRSRTRIASAGLLAGYIYIVLASLVLTRNTGAVYTHRFRPFWSYRLILQGSRICLWQDLLNIILFIPIGFLTKITFPKWKLRHVMLAGTATSVVLEILQYFLRKGLCETDDVINNTIGTLIGYGIVLIGTVLFDTLFEKDG